MYKVHWSELNSGTVVSSSEKHAFGWAIAKEMNSYIAQGNHRKPATHTGLEVRRLESPDSLLLAAQRNILLWYLQVKVVCNKGSHRHFLFPPSEFVL